MASPSPAVSCVRKDQRGSKSGLGAGERSNSRRRVSGVTQEPGGPLRPNRAQFRYSSFTKRVGQPSHGLSVTREYSSVEPQYRRRIGRLRQTWSDNEANQEQVYVDMLCAAEISLNSINVLALEQAVIAVGAAGSQERAAQQALLLKMHHDAVSKNRPSPVPRPAYIAGCVVVGDEAWINWFQSRKEGVALAESARSSGNSSIAILENLKQARFQLAAKRNSQRLGHAFPDPKIEPIDLLKVLSMPPSHSGRSEREFRLIACQACDELEYVQCSYVSHDSSRTSISDIISKHQYHGERVPCLQITAAGSSTNQVPSEGSRHVDPVLSRAASLQQKVRIRFADATARESSCLAPNSI